ncbi:helix-turn-helix domain-containing protein [Amycolatopsis sp. GM8]|uniref:helix-turn-helix domain-containing protein n=1 Tax=Amycolatopsis sp. GM8 TaxID=2896530 RepID=UPI001F007008|nr:helix-turn-helix domain-containing protein [Amycolatopsis sp. GM8]
MTTHVVSGLNAVQVVGNRPDPTVAMPVGEIAERLGTALSSTSRLCGELEELELLERGKAYGTYRLGRRAIQLSGRAAAPFARSVRYALTLVAALTGETACLAAPSAHGMRVVASVESVWTLRAQAKVGELVDDARRAIVRAARPDDGGPEARHVESTVGMCVEIAVPVVSSTGQCVAVLAARLPVSRAAKGVPQARRLLDEARRLLERNVADEPDRPNVASGQTAGPEGSPPGLDAALRIMWHLSAGRDSLAGIASATGLRPDRTRRLLDSCGRAGVVRQSPDGLEFEVSWAVHGWHRAATVPMILEKGQPLVAEAANETGVCAFITVMNGMRSLTLVEELQSVGEGLGMTPWLGRLAPIIGSDGGPTLVSDFEAGELRRVLPTRHPPAQVEVFMRRFARAGRDGVLSMKSIDELGIISISAPVRDSSNSVAAAACLVSSSDYIKPRARELEDVTRRLGARVSRLIGAPDATR